jgi:predicted RNA-binding protein with TRAM domain
MVDYLFSYGGLRPLEISDKLLCLFSADVTLKGDEYVVSVPRREIDTGSVEPGETYRVALISRETEEESSDEQAATTTTTQSSASTSTGTVSSEPQPPVEAGEIRYVEVEDIGKQGDGIARVERGYVIIVPGAEIGERVKVEITEVKSNFAVGEIIEEEF